ncbi:M14 family metallopeptidase [Bacillus kexueae]|uniref:M14 family metallopeptidase n=1 Tax=Aeribacillus kexueae TaxID=2078952 RepID=UPI001FAEF1B6|nr:M14 family metallocarboxypeptidase [Bacillus kexueae]
MEIYLTENCSINTLANHFQLPVELILQSNPLVNSLNLEEGSTLHIPGWRIDGTDSFESIRFDYPYDLKKAKLMETPLIHPKVEYDFDALQRDLQLLEGNFPFIRKKEIGKSVLGLPIYELIIGNGPKKVHMNGAFHANEWITTAVMMNWLEDYLMMIVKGDVFNGREVRKLYEEVTLSFVPMVNPDGVNLVLCPSRIPEDVLQSVIVLNDDKEDFSQWKANIRGVDLNNQYPAFWEIEKERKIPKSPAPRDFPGNAPLTEPEAMAMAILVEESNFDCVAAFHTQGEEIYWGYLNYEPKRAAKMVNEFKRLSGYKPVRNIDSHAGFRDWFVYKNRKPGFTVELGRGVNPLPLSQYDEIYEKSHGIFWSLLYM